MVDRSNCAWNGRRMHFHKGCVTLYVIIVNTFQIQGVLEIHFPTDKVGNYGESTEMNCTDGSFNIANGYSWYKDNTIIYNSASGNTGKYKSLHGTDYFTLEITDTSLTDNGVYRCNYNFQDQSDTLEIQAKGSGVGEVVDDKLVLKLTRFYPGTTTISAVICNRKTITGSPKTSTDGGSFFNLLWTSSNIVDTNDLKAGCDVTILSRSTYNIQVSVKIGTTSATLSTSTIITNTNMTKTAASTNPSTTNLSTVKSPVTDESTTVPPTAPTTSSPTPSTTIIVLSVVGGAIIILVICIIVCRILRKKSNREKNYSANSENEEMPQVDINDVEINVTRQQ